MFGITSSIGLPLEVVLDELNKRNMVIDWKDYYGESISHGGRKSSVISKIESAVGDCFGSKCREEVSEKLKILGGRHI